SESPLKQFANLMKRIVAANDLPDYDLAMTATRDGAAALRFVRRDAEEKAQMKAALVDLAARNARRLQEDARAADVDALMARRRGDAGDR
ncbi:MAG TPA: hypothetical protein VF442_07780, partial [Sphingobium sp.]